jgi:hypothetical protein
VSAGVRIQVVQSVVDTLLTELHSFFNYLSLEHYNPSQREKDG